MTREKQLGFPKHVACLPKNCRPVNGLPVSPGGGGSAGGEYQNGARALAPLGLGLRPGINFRASARASASDEGRVLLSPAQV